MEAVGPCSLGNGGRAPTFLGRGRAVERGSCGGGVEQRFAYR